MSHRRTIVRLGILNLIKKLDYVQISVYNTKIRQCNLGTKRPKKKKQPKTYSKKSNYIKTARTIENFLEDISYNTRIKID